MKCGLKPHEACVCAEGETKQNLHNIQDTYSYLKIKIIKS